MTSNIHETVAAEATPGRQMTGRPPLCFVVEEDFVFRQGFGKELRRQNIDVVEFSNSSRLMDMVEEQNPDIVFINLNGTAPHECVRAFLALKECGYPGAVQLFGHCEKKYSTVSMKWAPLARWRCCRRFQSRSNFLRFIASSRTSAATNS
jgi:PleD family two-component response regulator